MVYSQLSNKQVDWNKRVGWNFFFKFNKRVGKIWCCLPVKCPQVKASRVDFFFLEKNRRACLFIRELRVLNVYIFVCCYNVLTRSVTLAIVHITSNQVKKISRNTVYSFNDLLTACFHEKRIMSFHKFCKRILLSIYLFFSILSEDKKKLYFEDDLH